MYRTERALAYLNLNQLDNALQDARVSVEQSPIDHRARNTIGYVLFHKDDFQASFDAFASAANIDPGTALYKLNAGRALARLGYYDTAIKWFDSALVIEPQNDEAKQARQMALNHGTAQTPSDNGARSENVESLIGTWSLNITESSNYLHAYITLGREGQYGGVLKVLNQDRTVNEQLVDGTWIIRGNQLTITTVQGEATTYTVQLSGTTLNVFQQGKHLFSYRKIG